VCTLCVYARARARALSAREFLWIQRKQVLAWRESEGQSADVSCAVCIGSKNHLFCRHQHMQRSKDLFDTFSTSPSGQIFPVMVRYVRVQTCAERTSTPCLFSPLVYLISYQTCGNLGRHLDDPEEAEDDLKDTKIYVAVSDYRPWMFKASQD
jgi:hypothetical protein